MSQPPRTLFTPVSDMSSLRRVLCCSVHGVGISRHSFLSMENGHAAVGRKATGFDFSRLLELEPSAALDPVDNPETLEVLSRILCGPEDYDYHVRQRPPFLALCLRLVCLTPWWSDWQFYMGDLRCSGAGPGLYPSDEDNAGYTYWHRDHPQPNRWPITRSRDVKMFVNIFDVPYNGGPLSVVPGSHKLPFNPWETFGKSFKSSLTLDAELNPQQMPNHVKFAAPAGSALIFDTSCWHTPMPNTSGVPRRVYNCSYYSSATRDNLWDIAEQVLTHPPQLLIDPSWGVSEGLRAVAGAERTDDVDAGAAHWPGYDQAHRHA